MNEAEMIRLARLAIDKHWSFEQLKYCDYLYGKESLADEVWDFVEECREIGCTAFDLRHHAALAPASPNKESQNG